MSGHIARKGFQFQDHYLLFRVLRAASDSLDSAWQSGANGALNPVGSGSPTFGLEASPPSGGYAGNSPAAVSLDWDVLILSGETLEFAEVKSGEVSKNDRTSFWRRLRREPNRASTVNTVLTPVLVVDPTKIESLAKWKELHLIAATYSGSLPTQKPAGNVSTVNQLFSEALWELCCPDSSTDSSDPPVSLPVAIAALSRFELHCHEATQLESQVAQYLELLFPGGLTDTQHLLLLGWLGRRATCSAKERRLFSIRDLLLEIGVLQAAVSLTPGTLKEWRDLWNEAPIAVRARTRMHLGNAGESIPADRVQAKALAALLSGSRPNLVIIAPGGAGKSTFAAQAVTNATVDGNEIFHCGADDISSDELEQITKAIRFRAALTAIRRPEGRLFLCIDGLDEADTSMRKRWAQILFRLGSLPNVQVLVSMRDAIWRSDSNVRNALGAWPKVSLELWSEALVVELLAPTPFHTALPLGVIDLLRTPILLDLFWRTFVESQAPDILRASQLQTRHHLLSAFWDERLLNSARHASGIGISERITNIVAIAAKSVGGFSDSGLDVESMQILLSEGVLTHEGRLRPRLLFRHPLLRDFVYSQWCLDTSDPSEVSRRCKTIQGGLQRYGALRAIFEALTDSSAKVDHPYLALGRVIQAIVSFDRSLASQVAHVLGSRDPTPPLDPANWDPEVQASLPPDFARDLLSAARLDGNPAWAARLVNWPTAAKWYNTDYPTEVWRYASFLWERVKATPSEPGLREMSRQAARQLRAVSEAPEFASEFSASDRWLKMQAMLCVIPVLTDDFTFAWIERELKEPSWRTRSFLLEQLIYLARIDAPRTAIIYRRAVGLSLQGGRPIIDSSWWTGSTDHQAIDWSLAGRDPRLSLLNENPQIFLPVALDLAEGLWRLKYEGSRTGHESASTFAAHFDLSLEEDPSLELSDGNPSIGDLIDDSPDWHYQRGFRTNEPLERCLDAIIACVEGIIQRSASALALVTEVLRSSRLASVHMFLFDVLLRHQQHSALAESLRNSVLDFRLLHIYGFLPFFESGFIAIWQALADEDRIKVFSQLRALLALKKTEDIAKDLLARLPAADLPADLQCKRPVDGDPSYKPLARPSPHSYDLEQQFTPLQKAIDSDPDIGNWPDLFDRVILTTLARSNTILSQQDIPVKPLKESVCAAFEVTKILFPLLRDHLEVLNEPNRFWVLQGMTHMLECFRKTEEGIKGDTPSAEAIVNCAELALAIIKDIPTHLPGGLPEGNAWTNYRESYWGHALRLADAALVWPPVADDIAIQSRFANVVEAAFATDDPLVQLVCIITIRPWHWLRSAERRQLQHRLVWTVPKHPSVLAWSLSIIHKFADVDRAAIFRLLLCRTDLLNNQQLADTLGQQMGIGSMCVFPDGQRSAVAEVVRAAIDAPDSFPLLQEPIHRSEFLRSLIFGMKEQAKLKIEHPELAFDYGDWALKVWRILRAQRQRGQASEGIVLLAMHWLERQGGQLRDSSQLKPWWEQLQPLIGAVIRDGGVSDCFTLFFNFRSGEFNDLTTSEELLSLIEEFVKRIWAIANGGAIDLGTRNPEHEGYHSWRDCADHAAEAIESMRSDGMLKSDINREHAHRLLSTLAAEPIRGSQAIVSLYRIQND